MSFPYLFHENFETGTAGTFDLANGVDPEGRIDFPDHRQGLHIQPWRGAYVMRVDLNRGFADSYVESPTGIAIGAGTNRYFRFWLNVSQDFWIAPGSSMRILRVSSAGSPSVEEISIGISRVDVQINNARLAIRSPDDNDYIHGISFPLGTWLPIEVSLIHDGATSRCYLHVGDDTIQVNRMDWADFIHFRLGALGQSKTIRGTLYFDDVILDNLRLFTPYTLAPDKLSGASVLFTKTSYVFVGPGTLRGATLISGGTDNVASFYDIDRLPLAYHDMKVGLRCAVAESKDSLIEQVEFKRGCYLEMTGTNPQVLVHYGQVGAKPT